MHHFNIINSKNEWNKALNLMKMYDFYHTHDYHKLSANNGEGSPVLILFTKEKYSIALPLLERNIDELKEWKDMTSVYGYVGPLYSHEEMPPDFIEEFQNTLKNYLTENNYVSVFSRLHTLLSQDIILSNLGEIIKLGNTVTIDLSQDIDSQRTKYSRSIKRSVNKLRRTVSCKIDKSDDFIEEFMKVYWANMDRVNAESDYYFNKDYFDNFIKSTDFESNIILALNEDNEVMAGALFTFTDKIVQYHLGGTYDKYLEQGPMKLIFDEIRLFANKRKADYFHLGGGVGSSADSLFDFKSRFSDRFDSFKLWRYIVNKEQYDRLVEKNRKKIKNQNFFPLYRG